jgi:hypothetical protein
VGGGIEATQREVARFSSRDAQRLPDYYERLEVVADVLRDLLRKRPPTWAAGCTTSSVPGRQAAG